MIRILSLAAVLATGCLGPLASDTPATGNHILPPGTSVPALADDPAARSQLAENDGVDGVVRLQSAFAGGASIKVWDFGPAPVFAAPLLMVARRDATGELVRIPHNTIIAAVPGDPGYSPFWAISAVEVTERFAGEIFPSFAAVEEAITAGLLREPIALGFAVNCPAVAPEIRVAVGGGQTLPPNATFYYEGTTVPYFDFGKMPLTGTLVPEQRRYQLRRDGQEPLSEVIRNVDMTGDGDTDDSNDIFVARPAGPTASPLVRTVMVAVPTSITSIDDSGNETVAELGDASQLFAPAPTANVVGFQVTGELRNWAAQQTAGGL